MKLKGYIYFFNQRGLSLVEVMISLVLGIVLVGGVLQMFVTTKSGYRQQEGVANMQENGRYAMHILRENILMAGYPRFGNIAPFIPANTNDGVISDQITISYESNTDCLGSNVAAGTVINQLFVDTDTSTLRCIGDGGSTGILVEGIEAMQILYGLDDDNDSAANRYVTATEVAAGVVSAGTPDWNSIVSVRVALLARSLNTIGLVESRTYQLLDAAAIARNDSKVYRIFTTTIPLRNRIP